MHKTIFLTALLIGQIILFSCAPSAKSPSERLKQVGKRVRPFDENKCLEKKGSWNASKKSCSFKMVAKDCEKKESNPNCITTEEVTGIVETPLEPEECTGENYTYINGDCLVKDISQVESENVTLGLSEGSEDQFLSFAIPLEECQSHQGEWISESSLCSIDRDYLFFDQTILDATSCVGVGGAWADIGCFLLSEASSDDVNQFDQDGNALYQYSSELYADYTPEQMCELVYKSVWDTNSDPEACLCPSDMHWVEEAEDCYNGSLYFYSGEKVVVQVRHDESDTWKNIRGIKRKDNWFVENDYWPLVANIDGAVEGEDDMEVASSEESFFGVVTIVGDDPNFPIFFKKSAGEAGNLKFKLKNSKKFRGMDKSNSKYWAVLGQNSTFEGIVHGTCWSMTALTLGATSNLCASLTIAFEAVYPFGELVIQHPHNDKIGDDGTRWHIEALDSNKSKEELALDLKSEKDKMHIHSEPFYLKTYANTYRWGEKRDLTVTILGDTDFVGKNYEGYGPSFRASQEKHLDEDVVPQFRFVRCDKLCQVIYEQGGEDDGDEDSDDE